MVDTIIMVVMAFTFGRAMAWCFRKLNPFFMVIGVMMFTIPLFGLFQQNNLAIHIAMFAGMLSYFPMFNFFEAIGNFSLKNPENDRPKPSKITEDLEDETIFRSAPFGNSRNYYAEEDSQPSDNNYDDFEDYSSPPPQGSQDRFEQERADFEEYKEATAEELKRAFDEYMHEEVKKHAEEMKRKEEELKRREEELNRKEENFKNERTRKAGSNSQNSSSNEQKNTGSSSKNSSNNEQKSTGSSNKNSSNNEQKSTGEAGAESKNDSSYDDRFYTNEKPLDPTKLTDAYKILGITPQTSKKDAKRAFMKLRSLYSPDKVDHLGEERVKRNTEQMKIINVAWDKVKKHLKK